MHYFLYLLGPTAIEGLSIQTSSCLIYNSSLVYLSKPCCNGMPTKSFTGSTIEMIPTLQIPRTVTRNNLSYSQGPSVCLICWTQCPKGLSGVPVG